MESSSLLSGATDTDEGLDMFQEAGPGVEGAGSVWSVSCKLQKAVEKLLITLSQTHTQVRQAHRDKKYSRSDSAHHHHGNATGQSEGRIINRSN